MCLKYIDKLYTLKCVLPGWSEEPGDGGVGRLPQRAGQPGGRGGR